MFRRDAVDDPEHHHRRQRRTPPVADEQKRNPGNRHDPDRHPDILERMDQDERKKTVTDVRSVRAEFRAFHAEDDEPV